MSGMRNLARTVSANKSYHNSGTTSMTGYFFDKLWRERAGHHKSYKMRPTKVSIGKKAAMRRRKG